MANNFSQDANCMAVWRLESGALGADSKSTNTLTNTGVAEDTTNFKEGACSGLFTQSESDQMKRLDPDLTSGFPLKSGETNKTFSFPLWFRPTLIDVTHYLPCKTGGAGSRSMIITMGGNERITLYISADGTNWNTYSHASVLSVNTWYHITVTYDGNGDDSYRIRIHDSTQLIGTDLVGTASDIHINTSPFYLGYPSSALTLNGNLDEVVAFNDVLTTAEIDQIWAGTYGAGQTVTLAAAIAAAGGLTAASKVERKLSAAIAGAGTVTPAAQVSRKLTAAIGGGGALAAAMKVDRKLAAAIAAAGGLSGTLTIQGLIELAGQIAGQGGLSGAMKIQRKLAAQIAGQGGLAGSMKVNRNLSTVIAGQGGLAGALTVPSPEAAGGIYASLLDDWLS